jgi:hypothetical protein
VPASDRESIEHDAPTSDRDNAADEARAGTREDPQSAPDHVVSSPVWEGDADGHRGLCTRGWQLDMVDEDELSRIAAWEHALRNSAGGGT